MNSCSCTVTLGLTCGKQSKFHCWLSARESDLLLRHRIVAHQQGSITCTRHQPVLSAYRNCIGAPFVQCIVTARGLVLAGEAYVVMAPKTTPVGVFAAAFSASLQAAFTVTQGALVAKSYWVQASFKAKCGLLGEADSDKGSTFWPNFWV